MNINIKYSKKVESRNTDYCNKEMTKDFLYEFNVHRNKGIKKYF